MTSVAGAVIQPIFHPVVLNVLPPDEMEIVRSRAPGSDAIGVCGGAEREVLVHLVGHDDRIVPLGEPHDRREHVGVEHRPGRVVRRVHEDDPGAVGHRRLELVEVGPPVGEAQRHRAVHASGAGDERRVGVVVRLERHDLVAHVDEREDGRRERLGGAGRDEHLGCRVDVDAVEPSLVRGDRLAQHGHADAGRVLVHAVGDRLTGGLEHLGGAVLVGEALAEVDGAGAGGQGAHLGEDRGGDRAVGGEQAGACGGALPRPQAGRGGEVAHALTVRQGRPATLAHGLDGRPHPHSDDSPPGDSRITDFADAAHRLARDAGMALEGAHHDRHH